MTLISTPDPWATACPDWDARFMAGRSMVPDFPLLNDPESPFAKEAAKALRIFRRMRIPDVAGTPTMGEACGPWIYPIIAALFGSYDAVSNRRMINELFLLVPKKNAKTANAAAIMLTALTMNRRPDAEFQIVAPLKNNADISFDQICGIIRLDPALSDLFNLQYHIRTITHRRTGASLKVESSEAKNLTGGKKVGTLIDEIHELAGLSRAAAIYTEIRGALAARTEGFVVQITTQSKSAPSGVFRRELNRARAIRSGELVLPVLPVLYELPAELTSAGEWKNRAYWHLVNPNLNISVDEQFLVSELVKAEHDGQEALAMLASQHFNVEIGVGLRSDHWPGARHWQKNADANLTLADIIARSDAITIGIDGGGLDDILGAAVLGRDKESRQWLHYGRGWLQRDVLNLRKQIASQLLDFEAAGDLILLDEIADANEQIADLVEEIFESGKLYKVGLDPFGVKLIVDAIARRQITQENGQVEGVSQGFRLQGTIKSVEVKLSAGQVTHCGQPMMDFCVSNCKVEVRGSNVLITKQASGIGKIDPVLALFDAASLMLDCPDQHGSIYSSSRGLAVFG